MSCRLFELSGSITFFRSKIKHNRKDNIANNIAIICKKYYFTAIFKEIGRLDTRNETYEKINKNQEEIIQDNLEHNTSLKLSSGSKDKSLPIIYWIPKLHKNPVSSRVIIASQKLFNEAFVQSSFQCV